jgi:hypothetical protein
MSTIRVSFAKPLRVGQMWASRSNSFGNQPITWALYKAWKTNQYFHDVVKDEDCDIAQWYRQESCPPQDLQYLCFFVTLVTKVINICRGGSCFLASRQLDDFPEPWIIGPGKRKDFVPRIVQMSGVPILSYYHNQTWSKSSEKAEGYIL